MKFYIVSSHNYYIIIITNCDISMNKHHLTRIGLIFSLFSVVLRTVYALASVESTVQVIQPGTTLKNERIAIGSEKKWHVTRIHVTV